MANEFLKKHTIVTETLTPVDGGGTVTSTTAIPPGALITEVLCQNITATTLTATLATLIDGVTITTAVAQGATTLLLYKNQAIAATGVVPTLVATNGGMVGITSSAATYTGTVKVYITYIL